MLQSMGLPKVKCDLVTEQQNLNNHVSVQLNKAHLQLFSTPHASTKMQSRRSSFLCPSSNPVQDSLTTTDLKIPCVPPICPLSPNLWQPLIFFCCCSHSFTFPKCHMVGIIQHVTFSDFLLSLSLVFLFMASSFIPF